MTCYWKRTCYFMLHKSLQNIKKTSKLFSQYLVCKTHVCVYVCVLVAQSCLTLCKSMDCSPPGSSVYGILQARILEWVAIPFSRGSSWPRDWTPVSWGSGIVGKFFTTEPPGKPKIASSFMKFTKWLIVETFKLIQKLQRNMVKLHVPNTQLQN